jgi:hypothetical protein
VATPVALAATYIMGLYGPNFQEAGSFWFYRLRQPLSHASTESSEQQSSAPDPSGRTARSMPCGRWCSSPAVTG